MTKKFLPIVLAVIITLTGCSNGISQKEYDALLAENEQLKQQLAQYNIKGTTNSISNNTNNDSTSIDTAASVGANLKVVDVEDLWYDFDDENHYTIYLKIRNKSGMSLGEVLPSIDIIDENGDIVASTAAGFMQVLDDGQGCTIDSDWVESTEAPYGVRISSMFIEDTEGNLEKIVINPAYVMENIPSSTSRQQDSKGTQPTQPQNNKTTSSETTTTSSKHTCTECGNSANRTYKNPFSEVTEHYCENHYQEIIAIMGMMESDVGSSKQSKHICEQCSREGTHKYNSFTGQTEYYCTQHYEELMDMLEAFGLG